MAQKFYITTAIAYVNAKPHIGFAMEVIQADVLARYHRFKGDKVYFLTGTDEHGSKIVQTARDLQIDTKTLVDQNAEKFRELTTLLAISNDGFVRTSSVSHKQGAEKLWQKMYNAGDIYKDTYVGLYCVGCESFVPSKDLVDGKCPFHLKEPQEISEENYFFRLSKYSKTIAQLIRSDTLAVLPQSRKSEILNVVEEGLTDVSFSRPKSVLPWGVSVPDDPSHVMYVWCDALSNYITALDYEHDGKLFRDFWPVDVHLIGKDILRFHAGVWIGMLLSAGVALPRAVYVHGFITSEGQKMSKSLNNVVDPYDIVAEYGVDALRYYLLREIPTTEDGDFSRERFRQLYVSELANALGNLLSRVTAMADRYCEGNIELTHAAHFLSALGELTSRYSAVVKEYEQAISAFDLKNALEIVMKEVDFANGYIERYKPWELAKSDFEQLKLVLATLLEIIRIVAVLLLPFIPETAYKMYQQLGLSTVQPGDFNNAVLFSETSFHVKKGENLFPRRE